MLGTISDKSASEEERTPEEMEESGEDSLKESLES